MSIAVSTILPPTTPTNSIDPLRAALRAMDAFLFFDQTSPYKRRLVIGRSRNEFLSCGLVDLILLLSTTLWAMQLQFDMG